VVGTPTHGEEQEDLVPAEKLLQGITIQIERKGFWALDLKQEV
jgi:hypothetical protein